MTCPTCGYTPSNNRTHTQLEIPSAMLLSMVHALAIGRNTEMMCQSQDAADEMEKMRKILFDQLGKSHTFFKERDWTKIMLQAQKGILPAVTVNPAPNTWKKYRVAVTFSDVVYFSTESVDDDVAQTIKTTLKDDIDTISPMI